MFRGVSNRRIIPYTRRVTSIGGTNALSYSLASYTNASPRNLLARNPSTGLYSMTGPFAGGTLATRVIGGKRYALIEQERATKNTYSEAFRLESNWTNTRVTVVDDSTTAPSGDMVADTVVEDTTPAATHQVSQSFTPDGSSKYFFTLFVKAKERDKGRILFSGSSGFPGTPYLDFDLSVPSVSDSDVDDFGILQCANDWFLVYFSAISNAAAATTIRIYLRDAAGNLSYDGDGSSGMYFWGANVIKANYLTSYIKAVATVATKTKDTLYWTNANTPAWLKGSQNKAFSLNFIPNYSSTQLTADGANKYLFSKDSANRVECYIDAATNEFKIDIATVNVFTSASALTWTAMDDRPKVTIIPNNGVNCRVILSGFDSGNEDGTGTAFDLQSDGDLYWGMRDTTADLQIDGLISEPRYGLS
jgi:hypothetical protein